MTDALKRYQELTANGAEPASPVERLRAFCSLAMGGQDWLDVETFFDAILDHVEAQEAEIERYRKEDEIKANANKALLAENERLTPSLKRTNDLAEHFERHWYLRGDEIERLRAERDELRRQLAEAEQDARRYRWLRGSSCPDHSRRWTLWEIRHWRAPFWTGDLRHGDLDAAIDAQIEKEKANGTR